MIIWARQTNHKVAVKTLGQAFLFPASRGLFSIVFAELTSTRKRDLCPGLKRTVLSMRHGYLVTEPSHDAMLLCGLTKWQRSNCKQMYERQWAQVTVSKQYSEHVFCKHHPRLQTTVESKSVSTQGRGLFSLCPSVQRKQWKRGLCYQGMFSEGIEQQNEILKALVPSLYRQTDSYIHILKIKVMNTYPKQTSCEERKDKFGM